MPLGRPVVYIETTFYACSRCGRGCLDILSLVYVPKAQSMVKPFTKSGFTLTFGDKMWLGI